ncbi:MAG: hypothetical protein KDJ14_05525 [Xanthomonadales bacterium]|nr:hypothetical protein [Xanthomonadales bacterium]
MDLLLAAAFLMVWVIRERFAFDTLRSLLLWPVIFEIYLLTALFMATWVVEVAHALLRWSWIASAAAIYLFAVWLTAALGDMPGAASIALWMLLARAWPPQGMRAGTPRHLQWLQKTAGYSALMWGGCCVAMLVLMLLVPGAVTQAADGTLRSQSPAWIFPLVWTPYFVAEGLLRTYRVLAAMQIDRSGIASSDSAR